MRNTKGGDHRTTVYMSRDLSDRLDAYCEEQSRRASSVLGTAHRVSRNKAIIALLRKALGLPDTA